MALPYDAGDPDISAPDDCESYQHINRVIGKHDDAVDLVDEQHDFDTDSSGRELHDVGRMPQGLVGMLIVEPPAAPGEIDGHTVVVQAGEVGETHWNVTLHLGLNEYWFEIRHPLAGTGLQIRTPYSAADVHSEASDALAGGSLQIARPGISVRSERVRIYFGSGDLTKLERFVVFIWGYRIGG